MQYYPTQTSPSKLLDIGRINGALGLHVSHIKLAETPRDGIVAAFSVKNHIRLRDLRKRLSATTYNEIDRKGLQIAGVDGLRIYANDKTDPEAQALHLKYTTWIKQIFEFTNYTAGSILGLWSLEEWNERAERIANEEEEAVIAAQYANEGNEELEEARATIDELTAQLERAQARIAELEAQLAEAARAP